MTLLLALGACQPAPPARVEGPARPGAEVVPPAPSPTLPLTWSFKQSPDGCHARAIGGAVRLDIAVRGHDPIELTLSGLPDLADRSGRRVAWVFRGATGNWRLLSAARASHDLVAYIAPGEVSSGKVLTLLNGGVLAVGDAQPTMLHLRLPPSDTAGQAWFDCVRRQR
jgi:hypothetical protein